VPGAGPGLGRRSKLLLVAVGGDGVGDAGGTGDGEPDRLGESVDTLADTVGLETPHALVNRTSVTATDTARIVII
jgi:hypothetical protein